MSPRRVRALFVNSGILGHATVARLIREAMDERADVEAHHVDLSRDLTFAERLRRRAVCWSVAPRFPLHRLRHEWHAGLQAAARIRALEGAHGAFDVIHFHPQATAYASLARLRRGRAVISLDCPVTLAARTANPLHVAMERRVLRAAAAVVATSRWAAEGVQRLEPSVTGRLHVLPYPVALGSFDERWLEDRRRRHTDGRGPVNVLFVGGDFHRKGGDDLLAAWQAGGFARDARLVVATSSPLDPSRLPEGVRLAPPVGAYTPEWQDLWREADVFAMPTRDEAFGMVFQEAAAAGLPSLGTKAWAIPEIVADGETGILVPAGDRAALIDGLQRLIASAALRDELGRAARARIVQNADPARYAASLVALFGTAGVP
jgi:starch synthase